MANTRSNRTLGSDRPRADGEERAPRMMQGSGRTGAAARPAGADQARQEACCQGRTQQLPPESYFKLRGVYHKKKVIYRSSKGNLAQSSGCSKLHFYPFKVPLDWTVQLDCSAIGTTTLLQFSLKCRIWRAPRKLLVCCSTERENKVEKHQISKFSVYFWLLPC